MTAPQIKEKPLRGLRRVIVHIVLCFALGVTAVIVGLVGRGMLADRTEQANLPTRVNVIHAQTEALLKEAALSGLDETDDAAAIKAVGNGFSGKRRAAKSLIQQLAEIDTPYDQIVANVTDLFLEGIRSKLDTGDPLAEQIEARMARAQDEISIAVARMADDAADDITMESVRMSMSVTNTPNYALLFYGSAFIWIGVALLALSALLTILWFTRDEEGRRKLGALIEPFDYLLPFLLGVAVFTIYPMVRVTVMSFQEKYQQGVNGFGSFTQWGFGNYEFVLKGLEGTSNVFLKGLGNTAQYVAWTVPISTAIAVVLAYLLNQKIKLSGFFQMAYFIPMVTTVTAVGLVWRWMFNTDFGLINAVFTGSKINWLANYPMTVLVVFGVWSSLPFTVILLLSGLQNIDDHLYTVAKVDGSGAARIFFRITVPLLSPTIGLVLIINSISAFKVYTDVVVLWNGMPENYGMQTVTWYIYDQLITPTDGVHSLGYAAAAAMVLFLIIFAFTMIQRLIQRKWVYQ